MSMAENEGGEEGSEGKMDVDDKDQDYSEVGPTLLFTGLLSWHNRESLLQIIFSSGHE